MQLLSSLNVVSASEELNFLNYFILITLNLNIYYIYKFKYNCVFLVITILNNVALIH